MKKISSGYFLQWLRFPARGNFRVLVRDGATGGSWTHLQGFTESTATHGTIPSDRNPGSIWVIPMHLWMRKISTLKRAGRAEIHYRACLQHIQKKVSLGTRRETLFRGAQVEGKDEQWERKFGREEERWLLSTFLQVEIGCLARGERRGGAESETKGLGNAQEVNGGVMREWRSLLQQLSMHV